MRLQLPQPLLSLTCSVPLAPNWGEGEGGGKGGGGEEG